MIARFVRLFGWTAAAAVVDRGAFLLAVFISASLLTAAEFGRWGVALSSVQAIQVFAVLGGTIVINRFVPQQWHTDVTSAVRTIRLSFLVVTFSLSCLLLGVLIWRDDAAEALFNTGSTAAMVIAFAAWLLLFTVNVLCQATVISLERGKAIALSGLMAGASALAAIPLGAQMYGFVGMMTGAVVSELARFALLSWQMKNAFYERGERFWGGITRREWRVFWSFGGPVLAQSLLYAPVLWLAQFIVLQRHPQGLAEIGAFAYMMLFFSGVLMVSSKVNQAAMPIMASVAADKRFGELARFTNLTGGAQLLVAMLIGILSILLAPSILPAAYDGRAAVLAVVVFAAAVVSIQTCLANALLVLNQQWVVFWSIVPWAFTIIATTWLLQQSGALGIALGLLLAAVIRTVIITLSWGVLLWRWRSTPQLGDKS